MAVYLVASDTSAWMGLVLALGALGALGLLSSSRQRVSAMVVVTLLLLGGLAWAGQPVNGCQTCLANGNSWWWCFAIYGVQCYF